MKSGDLTSLIKPVFNFTTQILEKIQKNCEIFFVWFHDLLELHRNQISMQTLLYNSTVRDMSRSWVYMWI